VTGLFDAPEMLIKAIYPGFGSKRTLAPTIIQELGKHRAYWEPFCGSLAVLLAKPESSFETVNDLHGDLINLARVLAAQDTAADLYERLSRTLTHEDLFHEAAGRFKTRGHVPAGDVADVDRAYDFFVCSWMGHNGVAGTQSYNQGFCVRYTKNGGHAATRFQSCVESIPAWHARLRNITILSRCGLDLLERIEDAPGVCIYCDPPYLVKGAKYVYDFNSSDHQRLSKTLPRFKKTRVVVSYYKDAALPEMYPWWTIREVFTRKSLANQNKRDQKGVTIAPEILLINGPSYAEAA